jgi:hypothetical protein
MPAMDDPAATRQQLAEAEARLAADPDNEALAAQVRRLTSVLGCMEWEDLVTRFIAHCRLILDAVRRQN